MLFTKIIIASNKRERFVIHTGILHHIFAYKIVIPYKDSPVILGLSADERTEGALFDEEDNVVRNDITIVEVFYLCGNFVER